ncbi:secondary thiamine-phosphate synthase enzyme YjbQ [Ruegeria arenilitoris]|uniref:secondary thiamine-phosphate synthase enzyme YjbQ n=1 Tax=Ruegeria arenilitoris TaxID=1173585 RepID=UPI00147E2E92|nr:secondary thiamine-phosphate synthase enzyme YjbQ [Ruegeria arenilitoris]
MKQEFFELSIETPGKSLTDVSGIVQRAVSEHEFVSGLLTLWCVHTGAALLVQANADPDVLKDIETFFEELVPKSPGKYHHRPTEDDNAPSHLRALLTQTQVSIPVEQGQLPLGRVQSLYLFEHREAPKTRRLKAHYIGT